MGQKQIIDKTSPITLQDLIDLAKSKNINPEDMKLILNDNDPDEDDPEYTGYIGRIALIQDCGKFSIEIYTHGLI